MARFEVSPRILDHLGVRPISASEPRWSRAYLRRNSRLTSQREVPGSSITRAWDFFRQGYLVESE